jgi:hypothetical protein
MLVPPRFLGGALSPVSTVVGVIPRNF